MKKLAIQFILGLSVLLLSSCEKVVDIELDNAEPKLVIDALIRWQKGTSGNEQLIKLSLTNDFYTSDILPANGATVTLTNSANEIFTFTELQQSGNYVCINFNPVVNETYTLNVTYAGQSYTATNQLLATPSITNVEQETVPGFSGEDEIQIKYYFQDDGNVDNYYLLGVINPNKEIPEFGVVEDEFLQGNEIFGFYGSSETEPGITLKLSVENITLGFFNYMSKLIAVASSSGNPFATPPVTLRGNIINETNTENYPLGYFHLSEIDAIDYTVQ
ncbi:DUF4249 family protein [Flavobacterium chuncheonense]|uniref:DUF4249 family protein n=1 Tax=Flavobacterium chuncheonense TaxID=2026653 RepID=A0ABW5YNR0_9FLAO